MGGEHLWCQVIAPEAQQRAYSWPPPGIDFHHQAVGGVGLGHHHLEVERLEVPGLEHPEVVIGGDEEHQAAFPAPVIQEHVGLAHRRADAGRAANQRDMAQGRAEALTTPRAWRGCR